MTSVRPDPAQVQALAARLRETGRGGAEAASGAPLSLLHVPTGGCGGCRLELALLFEPPWDSGRHGLRLVTDPRHADVLVATGPLARNAAGALLRAWEAMPEPRFLLALGDCASDPAPDGGAPYALAPGGVRGLLPVDLALRGSPPPPGSILLGLLTLRDAIRGRAGPAISR